MSDERLISLDPETLRLFADKGTQLLTYKSLAPGTQVPQLGEINAVKVRRMMQLLRDHVRKPLIETHVFDFGCAEGVYAIEAALRGAQVRAFDARSERMDQGRRAAERMKLNNISFERQDIRNVTAETHGTADVVLLLGILYHLDVGDFFRVLRNVSGLCRQFAIIETRVALDGTETFDHDGVGYRGARVREHRDDDSAQKRDSRLLASIDNKHSFWPTRQSLFAALDDAGFTSVCECHVPRYPETPPDRVTLIASRGEGVKVSSYPWINGMDESQIARYLEEYARKMGLTGDSSASKTDRPDE